MDLLMNYIYILVGLTCCTIADRSRVQYHYRPGPLSWQEAVTECKTEGYSIARIESSNEQTKVENELSGKTDGSWIGGFAQYAINSDTSETCYTVLKNEKDEIIKGQENCTNNYYFICANSVVGGEYVYYHDSYENGEDGWGDSWQHCLKEQKRVGKPNEYDESLLNLTTMIAHRYYWPIFSSWTWLNETDLTGFSNWYDKEPSLGQDKCLYVNGTDGFWGDQPCSVPRSYVCENIPPTTVATTVKPSTQAGTQETIKTSKVAVSPVTTLPPVAVTTLPPVAVTTLPPVPVTTLPPVVTKEPANKPTTAAANIKTTEGQANEPTTVKSNFGKADTLKNNNDDNNDGIIIGLVFMGFLISVAVISFIVVLKCRQNDAIEKSEKHSNRHYSDFLNQYVTTGTIHHNGKAQKETDIEALTSGDSSPGKDYLTSTEKRPLSQDETYRSIVTEKSESQDKLTNARPLSQDEDYRTLVRGEYTNGTLANGDTSTIINANYPQPVPIYINDNFVPDDQIENLPEQNEPSVSQEEHEPYQSSQGDASVNTPDNIEDDGLTPEHKVIISCT